MAENDIIQLRGEINRLNSIIDIILNENRLLKQLLYNNDLLADSLNNLIYSYAQVADVQKQAFTCTGLQSDVQKKAFSLTGLQSDIQNKAFCDNELQSDVWKQAFSRTGLQSDVRKEAFSFTGLESDVRKEAFSLTGSQSLGVKQNNLVTANDDDVVDQTKTECSSNNYNTKFIKDNTISQSGIAKQDTILQGEPNHRINTVTNTIVPPANVPKPVNLNSLFNELERLNPTSNGRGLWNTAKILVRLRATPKQSLKELQNLTGLSEDGVVKRIIAMKKQGLITRQPGRRLVITAKAEELIQKAIQ